jgi:hypothetical protein
MAMMGVVLTLHLTPEAINLLENAYKKTNVSIKIFLATFLRFYSRVFAYFSFYLFVKLFPLNVTYKTFYSKHLKCIQV